MALGLSLFSDVFLRVFLNPHWQASMAGIFQFKTRGWDLENGWFPEWEQTRLCLRLFQVPAPRFSNLSRSTTTMSSSSSSFASFTVHRHTSPTHDDTMLHPASKASKASKASRSEPSFNLFLYLSFLLFGSSLFHSKHGSSRKGGRTGPALPPDLISFFLR